MGNTTVFVAAKLLLPGASNRGTTGGRRSATASACRPATDALKACGDLPNIHI